MQPAKLEDRLARDDRLEPGDERELLTPSAIAITIFGVFVAIYGDEYSPAELKEYAKLLRRELLLVPDVSKIELWGQRTEDSRYAIVYNHSATRGNRYPLVVMTGDDGHAYADMLALQGEVPPMRYQGIHKSRGPQYVRGIVPGNGNPPGDELWTTYSVNKEDIWVSRLRVPVAGTVEEHVAEDFEAAPWELDTGDRDDKNGYSYGVRW